MSGRQPRDLTFWDAYFQAKSDLEITVFEPRSTRDQIATALEATRRAYERLERADPAED
jgi:hypothetical protein